MNTVKSTLSFFVLLVILCVGSKVHASDAIEYQRDTHTGFYVGFANKETVIAEATWQGLNVVDMLQTVQIAKNPKCYQEVGQLGVLGNHPSTAQVYAGLALFSVLHYVIAKGIDHLVVENKDYMVLQRVYQYSNILYKGYIIQQNASYGIGLNRSRGCIR